MGKDYYTVLGIQKDASDEDIEKAYQELALRYQADKNSDANAGDEFKEIVQAYEVLSDKEKRDIFDREGEEGQRPDDGSSGHSPANSTQNNETKNEHEVEDDLEEGELKDDDDDDDDVDDGASVDPKRRTDMEESGKRLGSFNNDNSNDGGFSKESSAFEEGRHRRRHPRHHPPHQHQNYPPHLASGPMPPHLYPFHPDRRLSPESQHQLEMQAQYFHPDHPQHPHHFSNNGNNNHYRYPPNEGLPPPMNHAQSGGPPGMYPRGGSGGVGPMQKVNARCRFYSKTSNKCTWGDHCRFEHRDDSPGPEAEGRGPPAGMPMGGPGSSRSGPLPPMGPADCGPYPPYSGRHPPYPSHPTSGLGGSPYEGPYGHRYSSPPPLPPHHSMGPHWRQQNSPYPSPLAHAPEPVSPGHHASPVGGAAGGSRGSTGVAGSAAAPAPPGSSGSSSGGVASGNNGPPPGGAPSPGYPSPSSSSAVVYERKHRLAYELAPWNDRSGGYPPGRYDRGDPAGPGPIPGGRGSFYRGPHYGRELPYGREPPPHMGPHPGYPSYPSNYRGGPTGPYAPHYKYMSSSQRNMPPDSRRSRPNKRGHDEDESSWSDSGSEDSILGQANYGNKSHATKTSKQQHHPQQQPTSDNQTAPEEPVDQGSGTPPGEPLPEDRERQEMLLNKLKEIEDLMAKKKGEQEDSM